MAILRKKIQREPIAVPDDVIYFIAEQIRTNIRELEGALIRVAAYSLLEGCPMTLEMTKMVLKDMVKETVNNISVELVQERVSEFFKIPISDLRAKRRHKSIVFPRQMAMYLSRQLTSMSLPEIGGAFGGKDHTTVLHSCKKIEKDVNQDPKIKNIVDQLTLILKQ